MRNRRLFYLCVFLTLSLACEIPFFSDVPVPETSTVDIPTPEMEAPISTIPAPDPAPSVAPTVVIMEPADNVPSKGKPIYDVDSSVTGSQRYAPYGDSYRFNLFERPFLADMIYVQDLDIVSFKLSQDEDWYYVSINLVGNNPNNTLVINYGIEIDLNVDGFGDYIIWARPPYAPTWETTNVQVFEDSNNDSAGLSATQVDMISPGNGYEMLIYDGQSLENITPDLAWVRFSEDQEATVQFAFQKTLVGASFTLGVVSDAGLKDVSLYDYNDHFEEAEAGSPIKDKGYYPLGELYAFDNTCWAAYGFDSTGNEPKVCPPGK